MVTLRRFRELADSYGGDLQRWPDSEREAAAGLLAASPEARGVLDAARVLDRAILAASDGDDPVFWARGEQDAALARLRSGVAAQIDPLLPRQPPLQRRFGWGPIVAGHGSAAVSFRSAVLVAGGGLAILAGLSIGSLYQVASTQADLLGILQSAPIHGLWGE